jgi:hypothetical protein
MGRRWSWLLLPALFGTTLGGAALTAADEPPPVTVSWPTLELPTPPDVCAGPATQPFQPTTFGVEGIGTYPVRAVGRLANNVPGTPSDADKLAVGWDRTPTGIAPGSRRGKVILTTHAWPDFSALGNVMTARFDVGQVVILSNGRTHLCYRVTKKIHAAVGWLEHHIDLYDDPHAAAQVAIVTCSGTRLGPGNWDHREIWLAAPVDHADPFIEFAPRRH